MKDKFNKKITTNGRFNSIKSVVSFDEENIYNYEFLGMFDTNTKVWIWAYALPILNNELKKESESLHLYGLKQNRDRIENYSSEDSKEKTKYTDNFVDLSSKISILNFYFKTIFGNSRLLINNDLLRLFFLSISILIVKNFILDSYSFNF